MRTIFVLLLCVISLHTFAQLPGNSLQLKANGNFASVADAGSVSLNDTMTLEMMLYFRCGNGQSTFLMTKGWCGSTWSYYWSVFDQKLRFARWYNGLTGCSNNHAVFETSDSIPVNTWVHVAVVISDLSVNMYINGVEAGTSLISGNNGDGFHPSNQPIRIGNYVNLAGNNTGTPKANFDEVRIWHVARTPAQLQATMNNELSGNEAGLVAYYKLNESGSGAGISLANSKPGSVMPNGTTSGTAANLEFNDNALIVDALPTCDPILWLKADAGVTVNGSNEVTQWADQSGNNNHAIGNGTTLPTLLPGTINNKPVIHFTDDRLATPLVDLTFTQQTEGFAVYKGTGAAPFTPYEFSDDGNVVSTGFYLADQDNSCPGCQNDVTAGLKGNVGYNQNTLNQTQGCPKIIDAVYDKTLSSQEVKIWLNNVLQPKTPGTTDANNTNLFGNHKFYLGKRSANCTFCPGVMGPFYFAELVVFPRLLTPKERNQLYQYLNKKYFTGTSGTYNALPGTAAYSNAVYDDLSWKHSYNSANPGQIIASVKDYCLELGTRSDTVYVEGGAVNIGNAYAMRRHYVVQTALNPVGTKRVRLYYTQADFADLQAMTPGLSNHNQLCVTKYDGPSEDGQFNSAGGTLSFIPSNQITTGTAFGQRYLEFDVNGFSEFWIHGPSSVPLPIEGLRFDAAVCDVRDACLTWSAEKQEGLKAYAVERSADARTFETLARIAADRADGETYTYRDRPAADKVYYRLRAEDLDGTAVYSTVRMLQFDADSMPLLVPNPAHEELTLRGLKAYQSVLVTDMAGSVLFRQTLNGSTWLMLSTAQWPTGLYSVRLSGEGRTEVLRLAVRH